MVIENKIFEIKVKFNLYLSIVSLLAILLSLIVGKIPLIFIIIVGGTPLFTKIILKLFKGDFGADLLAALALVVSVYLGEYLAANLIIFMLASGQALEEYAMNKASSVLLLLAKRMPTKAWLKIGDGSKEVEVNQIKIGDEIIVRPHEICPVDGVVIEGRGAMDESYLTGEPYKLTKLPGSAVLSGAINGDSLLIIKAEKLTSDSSYAKIMKVMETAENNRPNLRRVADQIGAVFTPISLIFAFGTLYFTADLTRFLSILVVATPCPLLIAIPVTIISAISISAKRGIIIKDPRVLERLPTCVTAIFDKTGTLTCGEPSLVEVLPASGFNQNDVLQKVASLENYSRHPLAIAVLNAAKKANLPILNVTNISEKPGHGMLGNVNGLEIFVTSRKSLINQDKNFENILPPTTAGLECVIMIDNKYAAIFRFRDTPRPDGHSFIIHLKPSHSISRVVLLSGDRESEVSYLAELFGIKETLASQSPEDKLNFVLSETKKAPTLFMGDGINDAPALAAATVGLAFGQGSGITSEAAGAVIMDNTLTKVDELIHISESMRKIALQSAIGGMLFSLIAMGFAAFGYINPVTGALLQEIIDVAAILNALRMTWQRNVASDMKI